MILGKYKIKKTLGKGAYGQVTLTEDSWGKEYAIKVIKKSSFQGENSYLLEYIESEIACLKEIDSPHVMKLYSEEQDKDFKYLICEYCNGGDLINCQATQPNKVFKLDKAIEICADVIRGLEWVHSKGLLHRDIKADNILLSRDSNGKEHYKLADFGFAKNIDKNAVTCLGTEQYMGPEVYKEEEYGYEVDMWSFGVLFFYMLNLEYPFSIPVHIKNNLDAKANKLTDLAKGFSYKKRVMSTRKKIQENCTDEIEDLFQKMFDTNPKTRINFHDIRFHPVFQEHFLTNGPQSQFLYKGQAGKNKAKPGHSEIIKVSNQFPKENKVVEEMKSKADFFRHSKQTVVREVNTSTENNLALSYNLEKYYTLLLEEFLEDCTATNLKKQYPDLKMADYTKSNAFSKIIKKAQGELKEVRSDFESISLKCQKSIKSIEKENPYLKCEKSVHRVLFEGDFKKSYRCATSTAYKALIGTVKGEKGKQKQHNHQLTLISILHAFDKITDKKLSGALDKVFVDYYQAFTKKKGEVCFGDLEIFLSELETGQLNAITKSVYDVYFKK